MKGDHGQHGGDGEKGDIGETGERGPIGKTGPTHPYLGRTQTLVIFAFIAVAFVLLAYRTENAAQRAQQGIYEACRARAVITQTTPPNCERLR